MELVFHRFSPHRAIPHVFIVLFKYFTVKPSGDVKEMYVCMYVCLSVCLSVCLYVCMYVFFHIKTRTYSSFNILTNIVIKVAKYLMIEYCIPLI